MGDAGPPTPVPELKATQVPIANRFLPPTREIHVLVTGFGPFKSFNINPSWLIASKLPETLSPFPPSEIAPSQTTQQAPAQPPPPQQQSFPASFYRNPLASLLIPRQAPPPTVSQPLRSPNTESYTIRIHTYPTALRVAYDSTSILLPSLLEPATNPTGVDYDYVLHIGLASGRDSYTLETIGHRDGYLIPDIDERTGVQAREGETRWKEEDVPARLDVGWEGADVLRRWVGEVERRQQDNNEGRTVSGARGERGEWETGQKEAPEQQQPHQLQHHPLFGIRGSGAASARWRATARENTPSKVVVKLSRDAGRFLCEFSLMCSLVARWKQAGGTQETQRGGGRENAREKIGKVAFLHVPNGVEGPDVARGVMVAESVIRALVASWEAGYRNSLVYTPLSEGVVGRTLDKAISKQGEERGLSASCMDGFESQATGDAVATS